MNTINQEQANKILNTKRVLVKDTGVFNDIRLSEKERIEYAKEVLHQRLIKDKAIDMRDNFVIEELEDGYVTVKPIDSTKLYK